MVSVVTLVAAVTAARAAQAAPTKTASVLVDFSAGNMPALPHTWKRSFGSGHAALGLRPDWLGQLQQARDELGLEGVRQHGLFDDDMGPVVTGHRTYNFSSIERLWSSMVDLKLHPVVELSFMPSFLANCSWQVVGKNCHADYGIPCGPTRPGYDKCRGGMAYGATDGGQLPTDWDDWRHLVQETVQLAVTKFGLPEVAQWRWEVWNELWGVAGGANTPHCTSEPCIGSTYMALYNASAVGVKAVHPSLQVGGPATEHLNTQNFLSQAKAMGAPVDFVSSHNYPTGPRGDGSGCPQHADWDPDCFHDRVMSARQKIPATIPFALTEYSVMVGHGMAAAAASTSADSEWRSGEPPYQHDDAGAAAFVFRVVPQLAPHLSVMSYWTFSGESRPPPPLR